MGGKMIDIRYIHVDILYFYVESNEKRSQALLVFLNGKPDPTFDFSYEQKK